MKSPERGLRQIEEIVLFANAFDLWYIIEYHLKQAQVRKEEVNGFPFGLEKFKKNIDLFYECGTEIFLRDNKVGDNETYY